ncbi:MAG: hypothetical protein K9N52_02340 [Verrucomicrobia bacterium]|nr:hypothetical protein [Verrucomicrobiota bacterium]
MKETLTIIDQMKRDGVIKGYAIGGAVGATFYVEPMATLDVDVFVLFRQSPDETLISLAPIYTYCMKKGFEARGEYVLIGGWPVQFLPPSNALIDEAIAEAVETDVEGATTRIMSAEHLAAIALQLGRAKDHARILQFLEAGCLDDSQFQDILTRHGLSNTWKRFSRRFLEELP